MYNFKNTGKDLQPSVSLQKKNHQSFSLLYDTYAPVLFGIISRIISNEKMAEETLINTFLNIWNSFDYFTFSDTDFFNQVMKIGRQTAFDTIKNKEERALNINNHIDSAAYNDKEDTVFNLVYYRGYTLIEAASVLQIPIEKAGILLKTSIRNLNNINKAV